VKQPGWKARLVTNEKLRAWRGIVADSAATAWRRRQRKKAGGGQLAAKTNAWRARSARTLVNKLSEEQTIETTGAQRGLPETYRRRQWTWAVKQRGGRLARMAATRAQNSLPAQTRTRHAIAGSSRLRIARAKLTAGAPVRDIMRTGCLPLRLFIRRISTAPPVTSQVRVAVDVALRRGDKINIKRHVCTLRVASACTHSFTAASARAQRQEGRLDNAWAIMAKWAWRESWHLAASRHRNRFCVASGRLVASSKQNSCVARRGVNGNKRGRLGWRG